MRRALALACLLLAGCSDAPADPLEEAPAPAAPEAWQELHSWEASTVGSYCVWDDAVVGGCFGLHLLPQEVSHDLLLGENTTSARVELAWDAVDLRTATLEAIVLRGDAVVQSVQGTSPLAFDLEDLSPGTVTVLAYPPRPAGAPVQAHDPQPYQGSAVIEAMA